MTMQTALKLDFRRGLLLLASGLIAVAVPVTMWILDAPVGHAQSPVASLPLIPTGTKLEFEVASVRQNKSNDKATMNVDPTLGDSMVSTGGLYSAKNIVLAQYIAFAYKLTNQQLRSVVSQVPWVSDDQFDIEARAAGNPTKDQHRLMMQSLLSDRFKMTVHFETRQVPLFALVLAKSGTLGSQLRMHRGDDPVCSTPSATQPLAHREVQCQSMRKGFPCFAEASFVWRQVRRVA